MKILAVSLTAIAAITLPTVSSATDVTEILEKARELQQSRAVGLDAYVVERSAMGQTVSTWQVRTEIETADGEIEPTFMPMGAVQMRAKLCEAGGLDADGLDAFADATELTGNVLTTEIENGMAEAGLPRGLLAATGDKPWNTMNPRVMMGGNAAFLRAAANAQRENENYEPTFDAQENYDQMTNFAKKAKLVGEETVDGRRAFHIRATGLNQVHSGDDGSEFRIDAIDLLIDSEHYVPLGMTMSGDITQNGKSRPMKMENRQSDYRQVPGSNLYESYRQVTKLSGILSAEQQAQVKEAEAQLAEFEKQLAGMSAQERAMIESMMGDKIEQFRNMANGNSFKTETSVSNIRAVPQLTAEEVGCDTMG